jgi:hypothetical protein
MPTPEEIEAFRKATNSPATLTTPFEFNSHYIPNLESELVLVHTSITIPLKWIIHFQIDNYKVQKQMNELLESDSGFIGFSVNGKPIQGNYQTLTVWKDVKSMASFYARGAHGDVMKRWKDYIQMGKTAWNQRFQITFDQLPKSPQEEELFWKKAQNNEFIMLKRAHETE